LNFWNNLAISSTEKVRIYRQIFSNFFYIAFERYIAKKTLVINDVFCNKITTKF
jgi:hypothetical protein